MSKREFLLTLKRREGIIEKKLKVERQKAERLRYKSRRVRLSSPLGPRIGWLTDRLQELQLVIRLAEGDIKTTEFEHYNIDDSFGELCNYIGDLTASD